MHNLVVCCDGTWNTPSQEHDGVPVPTNVVRLYNTVAGKDTTGIAQFKYYHPGVGVERKLLKVFKGGAFGDGLSRNIKSAYKWLGATYKAGDRIYLFGFSRGAYTVRSLAGMLHWCGLLDLSNLPDDECWKRVNTAYKKGYQGRIERICRGKWAHNWSFLYTESNSDVGIFFLGVWDTVGALGVPNDLPILKGLFDRNKYAFHDAELSDSVVHARHAVALDEMRSSFAPTLWSNVGSRPTVKQIWFPGVHSDVGGGYLEKGLSDAALQWMMNEAQSVGLVFCKDMYDQIKSDYKDVLHNSLTGIFKYLKTKPRSIPIISVAQSYEVHKSAIERQFNPPIAQANYHPTFNLQAGEAKESPIYATTPWNETGIYLEARAQYRFTATGQWIDGKVKSGPNGVKKYVFPIASLWGKVGKIFQKFKRNKEISFYGTKREEDLPWLSLVGVVANCGNLTSDGIPDRHEIFAITDRCEYIPEKSGYLYCFANDAWCSYDNNRGSVMLTVRRL